MAKEILKIRIDNGLGDNNPTFKDIELDDYSGKFPRMGFPELTATLMWPTPLDDEWTHREYVVLRGEKFYVTDTPDAEKTNDKIPYRHDLGFTSEFARILGNTYFEDAVPYYSATCNKPCSNSPKFTFYGTISEFCDRLNCSFIKAGIADSVLKTKTSLSTLDTPVGDGYCVMLDPYGVGDIYDPNKTYEFSWDGKSHWEAITEGFSKTEVPFERRGKCIIFGAVPKVVDHKFEYGHDNELLSVKHKNAKAKVVNRITMVGSSENIPHYYPNETEYGHISITAKSSNKVLSAGDLQIVNMTQLLSRLNADSFAVLGKYDGEDVGDAKVEQYKYSTAFDNGAFTDYTIGDTEKHTPNKTHDTIGTWHIRVFFEVKSPGAVECHGVRGNIWKADQSMPVDVTDLISDITPEKLCTDSGTSQGASSVDYTHQLKKSEGTVDFGWLNVGRYFFQFVVRIQNMSADRGRPTVSFCKLASVDIEPAYKQKTGYYWQVGDRKYDGTGALGVVLNRPVTDAMVGDGFGWTASGRMPFQDHLVPPKYRNTLGSERFYNALNGTYTDPDTGNDYVFPNPYVKGAPSEHIHRNEDIKPTIEGVVNAGGLFMGVIADIAYDANDNDILKPDSDSGDKNDALKYEHSFFYIKLNMFNGPYGFDLFAHASQTDPMTIQMTDGSCNGCKFKIQAVRFTDDTGLESYRNPIIVQGGNPVGVVSEDGIKESDLDPTQQNTQTHSIWICVQKDADTFGVIMPNRENQFLPSVGDSFNIINIDLPFAYILAAENRLEEDGIRFMADDNEEKFTFDIQASRIFFAENPSVLAQLDEYSTIKVRYNGREYRQYVNQLTIDCKSNEALPNIGIDLTDTLAAGQSFVEQVAERASSLISNPYTMGGALGGGSGGGLTTRLADLRYLNKTEADRSKGKVASDVGFEVGEFVSGASGAILYRDSETGQTYLEVDKIKARMKAIFESLEISKVKSIGGKQMITPGGSIQVSYVEELSDAYRCYFKAHEESKGAKCLFDVGDQVQCEEFNIQNGTYEDASNRYYWRLVTAVNNDESYIEISKSDCDEGSDAPMAGDTIVQLGNRDNPERQSAIVLSTADAFAPCVTLYNDIDHYTLEEKAVVEYGVDKTKNPPEPFFNCYGRFFFGPRPQKNEDGELVYESYLKFEPSEGKLVFSGELINITNLNGKDIDQYIRDVVPPVTQEDIEDYVNAVVDPKIEGIQNQIDGVIETWFYNGVPTLESYPASEWDSDALKIQHLGDLYYDNDTGTAYRFSQDADGNYFWNVITDDAITKALAAAAAKRRVFTSQPTANDEYDVGDLWVNATYGTQYSNDILRCITPKAKGEAFDIAHWTLASKYTDDSALNQFISDYEDTIVDIKGQIDGKAQTWYQATDPSTTAKPNGWMGDDDSEHKGDLWYNIIDGTTWYWDGTQWQKQDVPKSVFDAIDGKADIFVNEDPHPYKVNDLWFLPKDYTGDNGLGDPKKDYLKGTLMVATQSSDTFNAAHWAKKDRYTDDTLANQAIQEIAGYQYIRQALANGATTTHGGLILTSLIKLGEWNLDNPEKPIQTAVWSGHNGQYNHAKTIASWWGGDMVDKYYNDSVTPRPNPLLDGYAQALIRMDGSGYLAGGNIRWDELGNLILGNGISLGGGNTTIGDVANLFPTVESLTLLFNKFSQALVPIKLVNGTPTEMNWADVEPDLSNLYAVKSKKGFYSDEFISARGLNPFQNQGVIGASALADLTDVNLGMLASGQALVYNGSKWVNQTIQSGGAGLDEAALATYLTTNNYAKKSDIPSLAGYAKEDWVEAKGYLTDYTIHALTLQAGVFTAKTYNPKTGAQTVNVPTLTSHLTNDSDFTTNALLTAGLALKADKSDYDAFKAWVEEMFELETDAASPLGKRIKAKYGLYSDYFISARGVNPWQNQGSVGLDEAQLAQYLTTNNYAKKSDIPSLTGYATQTWVENKKYLTAHQTIHTLTFQSGTFSAKAYTPNSAAQTVNIPTTTTHITEGTRLYFTDARAQSALSATVTAINAAIALKLDKSTFEEFKTLWEEYFTLEDTDGVKRIRANYGLYSKGFISAHGLNGDSGGGSGFGLMRSWPTSAPSNTTTDALASNLGYELHTKVAALESKNYLNDLAISVTGSGNAVTAVTQSADKKTLTFTKGSTFLTSHQTLYTLTIQKNGTQVGTFKPNANATINISDVASAATLSSHTSNTTVHITSAERTKWNTAATNLDTILGSDASGVIDKWDEIVAFLDTYTEADTLAGLLSNKADKTTKISAGTGLTGGGTLASDRTLSLATSGVTAGTYFKTTVDAYGRVTAGSNPTTLAGFGITDAYTKTEADGRYVNASGDTMTGDLSFATIATWPPPSTETYPIESKGLKWGGSSDSASIFYRVSASDRGNLVMNLGDDTDPLILFEWNKITSYKFGNTTLLASDVAATFKSLKIGDVTITYDATNKGLKISGGGLYSESYVSARGANSNAGGGGNFNLMRTWDAAENGNANTQYALGANLGWELHTKVQDLESKNYLNDLAVVVSGSGNAVTAVSQSADKKTLTFTKGTNFLTSITKSMVESVLTGNITSHEHGYIRGGDTSNLTSVVSGNYGFAYFRGQSTTAGIFPVSNNANGWLTINTHSGNYYHQLGFSSNGNLYHRHFSGEAIDTTKAWSTILTSSNISSYAITAHQSLANYVTLNTAQTITAKKTFTGGMAFNQGISENTSMPFFLGIDAFADGGNVRWLTASKVCAAIGAATSSSLGNYLPLAGGTLTGKLTINCSGGGGQFLVNNTAGGETYFYLQSNGTNKGAFTTAHTTYGTAIYNANGSKYLGITDDGVPHFQGNTLWHAGNDGADSGLDADMLDGIHAGNGVGYIPIWRYLGNHTSDNNGDTGDTSNHKNFLRRITGSSSYGTKLDGTCFLGTLTPNSQRFVVGKAYDDVAHTDGMPRYSYFLSLALNGALRTFGTVDGTYYEKTLAFLDSNVASADRLSGTTARTAWGQTFFTSGGVPQSVSGALSNVGNITPSADNASNLGSATVGFKYGYMRWVGAPTGAAFSLGANNATHITVGTNGSVGIGCTPAYKLDVNGTTRTTKLVIGSITLEDVGGNLHIDKGVYSDSFVSARGANSSGSSGGGLIQAVYGWNNLGGTFSDNTLTDTFNAYTINKLYNDKLSKTDAAALYQPKGNYLTSHQSLADYMKFGVATNYVNASFNDATLSQKAHDTYIELWDSPGWWNLMAGKFMVPNGTSSQFLKADGSVDSTSYLSSLPTRLSQYITSSLEDGNGFGRMTSATPFKPLHTGADDCMLVTTAYSDIWRGELALDYRTNNIAYRNKNNGTWDDWAMMLSDKNYTSYVTKIGTATVGSTSKPVYLNAGVPTALSATVGSASLPVYMSGGAITQCTASSLFSSLAASGNNISITVAGQNRTLTVPYATIGNIANSLKNTVASNGNKNNYPFHRILVAESTGSYVDKSGTYIISQGYRGGYFGVFRVNFRTNEPGGVSTCEIHWLLRKGFAQNAIQVGFNTTSGGTYMDVFYKSNGTYTSVTVSRLNEGTRSNISEQFTMIASNEVNNTTTTDRLTSTEVYASLADAASKLGRTYNQTVESADDAATVEHANTLSTARTLWGQSFNGSANVSGNMTGVGSISATGDFQTTKASAAVKVNNGSSIVGLYNSTNRGVYDFTTSQWVIATNGTNSWLSNGNVGIGTGSPAYKLDVSGDIRASGWLRTSGAYGWYSQTYGGGWYMSDATWVRVYGGKSVYIAAPASLKIGDCTITYENGGLHFSKGIYSDEFVSARGLNTDGNSGGLIQKVYGSKDMGKTFLDTSLDETFNAFTIQGIYNDVTNLKSGAAVNVETTGTGNAVTAISKSGNKITATKGMTFLTGITKSQVEAVLTGNITSHSHSIYATTSQLIDGSVTKIGTGTVGSTTKPIYLNAGVPTALSTTVGGTAKPMYLNAGTMTALSATVGASNTPVYLNAGTISAVTSVALGLMGEGGPSKSGSLGPLDLIDGTSATNKFEALPAQYITVEFWNGSNWVNAGLTDSQKTSLVSYEGTTLSSYLTNAVSGNKIRVTIEAAANVLYFSCNKFCINFSYNGAANSAVHIERCHVGSESTFEELGTYALSGWSGWNSIYFGAFSYGGGTTQTSNWRKVRFTFTANAATNTAYTGNKITVYNILAFGKTAWNSANIVNKWGRPYTYSPMTFLSTFVGGIRPGTDNSFELGSSSNRWKTVYGTTLIGNTWRSETYGGGWYMSDTNWVRTYNGKGINSGEGAIQSNSEFRLGEGGKFLYAYHDDDETNPKGYVGINNDSPNYNLDVVGNMGVTGSISSSVTSSTYLSANQGMVIVKSGAAAGAFTMLARMNSSNGYFTHGVYGSEYKMYYTAKSTVTAGTNSATKNITLLAEDGRTTLDTLTVGYGSSPAFKSDASGNVLFGSGSLVTGGTVHFRKWVIFGGINVYFTSNTAGTGDGLYFSQVAANSYLGLMRHNDRAWHADAFRFYYDGKLWAKEGIWSDGYVSARGQNTSSDAFLKNIIRPFEIDVRKIAVAPSVLFAWKDNHTKDVGSIAQYWKSIDRRLAPEGPQGYLTLQYGKTALLSVISVAKKVVSHEDEIKSLKKEVERLKKRVMELESK